MTIVFPILGIYIGDTDDASGAVVIGFAIILAIIFYFGYNKVRKNQRGNGDAER